MKFEFLECRDYGHAWAPYEVEKVAARRYLVRLRCSRCETVRSRLMSATGELLRSNVYIYPKGYLQKGGALHTKEGRTGIRAQVLRTLLERFG